MSHTLSVAGVDDRSPPASHLTRLQASAAPCSLLSAIRAHIDPRMVPLESLGVIDWDIQALSQSAEDVSRRERVSVKGKDRDYSKPALFLDLLFRSRSPG